MKIPSLRLFYRCAVNVVLYVAATGLACSRLVDAEEEAKTKGTPSVECIAKICEDSQVEHDDIFTKIFLVASLSGFEFNHYTIAVAPHSLREIVSSEARPWSVTGWMWPWLISTQDRLGFRWFYVYWDADEPAKVQADLDSVLRKHGFKLIEPAELSSAMRTSTRGCRCYNRHVGDTLEELVFGDIWTRIVGATDKNRCRVSLRFSISRKRADATLTLGNALVAYPVRPDEEIADKYLEGLTDLPIAEYTYIGRHYFRVCMPENSVAEVEDVLSSAGLDRLESLPRGLYCPAAARHYFRTREGGDRVFAVTSTDEGTWLFFGVP